MMWCKDIQNNVIKKSEFVTVKNITSASEES